MACWTLVIFSASSSGISHSNSSSRAITSSTLSRESAPRSSTNEDSFLMSASATPSCSATIFLTRASKLSIDFLQALCSFVGARKARNSTIWTASIHEHSAVDVQGRAGDIGRRGRAQEEDRLRDVLDPAEAPEGHALDQLLHLLRGQRAGHVGLDEPRRHAVHRDVAAADLAGERLGEAHDAGLGGGVVGLAGVAGEADYRGH